MMSDNCGDIPAVVVIGCGGSGKIVQFIAELEKAFLDAGNNFILQSSHEETQKCITEIKLIALELDKINVEAIAIEAIDQRPLIQIIHRTGKPIKSKSVQRNFKIVRHKG